jgi:hypothetical protein
VAIPEDLIVLCEIDNVNIAEVPQAWQRSEPATPRLRTTKDPLAGALNQKIMRRKWPVTAAGHGHLGKLIYLATGMQAATLTIPVILTVSPDVTLDATP